MPLIQPDAALATILDKVEPKTPMAMLLADALGKCLAEEIRCDRDQPPADLSAMDGFALRAADIATLPTKLTLSGEVRAGDDAAPFVEAGTCVRILTGACIPPGADTVVRQEFTEKKDDGEVTIRQGEKEGANIFRRGENAQEGDELLHPGAAMGALHVGVCASVGKADVQVVPPPTIKVICSGEELKEPGEAVLFHQIRNVNGPVICASLGEWGFAGATYETLRDDPAILSQAMAKAVAEHDVVILTGGVSKGRYDFAREAVESTGAEVCIHGVAMKPGKPFLYATLEGNRHVFGLPGNPLAALTGFHEFVLPALRRMAGYAQSCVTTRHAVLTEALRSKGDRTRFALVRLAWNGSGPVAHPITTRSVADMAAAGSADGVAVIPRGTERLDAGSPIEFHPWKRTFG